MESTVFKLKTGNKTYQILLSNLTREKAVKVCVVLGLNVPIEEDEKVLRGHDLVVAAP